MLTLAASLFAGGLSFLKRLPWQLWAGLGACLALWLLWSAHTSAVSQARSDGFDDGRIDATTTFVAEQAKAQAEDIAHAQAVKARDDRINREKSIALESQLASARAVVADYARRMQRASATHSGSSGRADLPGPTNAPGAAVGSGGEALVPVNDLNICSDAVVKATGWRDWWLTVSENEHAR